MSDVVSIKTDKNSLLSNYRFHGSYQVFHASLRSKFTKIKYDVCLRQYLSLPSNSELSTMDQVIEKNPKLIENEIIQHLTNMRNQGRSYSTLSVFLAAILAFFSINDVSLNRRKLSNFLGEQENKYEYRPYTHEEISKLLSICDTRGKMVVLLLASTGMRIGALPELRLKHLKRYDLEDTQHIYKIKVYATSKRSSYSTFCSPECAEAIDNYLNYRKQIVHRGLKKDEITRNWGPPDAILITRAFDSRNVPISSDVFTKPITEIGLRAYIVNKLQLMNLRSIWKSSENPNQHIASHKNEIHPCHSFRSFTMTQMLNARVDVSIREMLIGHNIGLSSAYLKPEEGQLLQEYLKAVDLLTFSKENLLIKKISLLEKREFENQNLINQKLIEREDELSQLKECERLNKDAIKGLSDKITFLLEQVHSLKEQRVPSYTR